MIKENLEVTRNAKKKVTRICDECGKVEETNLAIIYNGRKYRGKDIDLCASCSCSKKYKYYQRGREHHSWKHGIKNGYKRITIDNGKRVPEHRYIYEKHFGLDLKKKEVIHHIDLNRQNNSIDNLCLFDNHSSHKRCHFNSMEKCGIKLMGDKIWFNFTNKIYTLEHNKISCNREAEIIDLSVFGKQIGVKYPEYHMIDDHGNMIRKKCHVAIAEKMIGRFLYAGEVVHHIDCNHLNNDPNNLVVLTRKMHMESHYSLQRCVAELYKKKFVGFDKKIKEYYIFT